MFKVLQAFWRGCMCKSHQKCIRQEKQMRDKLSEKKIDRIVEDSFPASDPPSTY